MKNIFQRRFKENIRDNSKYLKYVFNDHFILIMFIIFGYLAYLYSQNLSLILKTSPYLIKTIISIIIIIEINSFHLVTFLQAPDRNFLLPKINNLKDSFFPATLYSMILPTITFILTSVIFFPILRGYDPNFGILQLTLLFLSLVVFVLIKFNLFKSQLYFNYKIKGLNVYFYIVQVLICSLFILNLFYLFILSTIIFYLITYFLFKSLKNSNFQVNFAIDSEIKRKSVIYKFYSLFIDIKNNEVPVKRRRYLDFVKNLKFDRSNFFITTFLRTRGYLGLFCRLLLINIFFVIFLDKNNLSIIMSYVFLYLFIFQLLPIFQQVKQNVLYKIYPIKKNFWLNNFEHFLMEISFIYLLLISLFSIMNLYNMLIILIGGAIFIILLIKYYFIPKLRKSENL